MHPFTLTRLDFFTTVYDTLYDHPDKPDRTFFSTAKFGSFVADRISTFKECLEATLFKVAELFVREWKEQKIVLKKEHIKLVRALSRLR